jgi:zona occludens toxin
MLNIMQGPPGAGKSYEAVNYHIVPALKGGCIDPVSKAPVPRQVITNLPVNVDVVRSVLGDAAASHLVVVPERPGSRFGSLLSDYKSSWRGPDNRGPLFVIDEAHKCVGTSGVSQDVLEWYAEHRHYGADVLLITQAHGKLHRQLVDMCQILFRTRKAIGLGTTKAYVRKVQDGPKGAVLSTEVRRYTFKGYAFYKSHTHSDSAVNEAVTSDVRSIWRQWPFLAAALVLPFAVYLIFHNRHNLDIIHPAPPMATFHAPVPVARAVPITTGAPGPVTAGAPDPVTARGPVPVTVPAAPLHPFSGIPAQV